MSDRKQLESYPEEPTFVVEGCHVCPFEDENRSCTVDWYFPQLERSKEDLFNFVIEEAKPDDCPLVTQVDRVRILAKKPPQVIHQNIVTFHMCGGGCPKGGEHVWDGPEARWENAASATCSKCGVAAIDHALLSEP